MSKIEVEAEDLQRLISGYFRDYLIPANGLDRQALMTRIKMGTEIPDINDVRQEMADHWAEHWVRMIRRDLEQ